MKISEKLGAAFLAVLVIVIATSLAHLYLNGQAFGPVTHEIPQAIEELEHISEEMILAQQIRYYDEVLTQSARNYAFTADGKWLKRYKLAEPLLDNAISKATGSGDADDADFFRDVNEANIALVRLEYESFK